MSNSPPLEIMNITNIMDQNQKNAAAAAAAHQGHHHIPEHQTLPHPHLMGAGIDRTNSPHGSESSHYSLPRTGALESLNGMGNARPYGSPTSMQSHLPMPDHSNMPPQGMMIPGMAPMAPTGHNMQAYPPPKPENPTPAPRAYPCSTCGKGFARRSDLARHGKYAVI
jgi:hypothetical protein